MVWGRPLGHFRPRCQDRIQRCGLGGPPPDPSRSRCSFVQRSRQEVARGRKKWTAGQMCKSQDSISEVMGKPPRDPFLISSPNTDCRPTRKAGGSLGGRCGAGTGEAGAPCGSRGEGMEKGREGLSVGTSGAKAMRSPRRDRLQVRALAVDTRSWRGC